VNKFVQFFFTQFKLPVERDGKSTVRYCWCILYILYNSKILYPEFNMITFRRTFDQNATFSLLFRVLFTFLCDFIRKSEQICSVFIKKSKITLKTGF